jgi:hypothetical protein
MPYYNVRVPAYRDKSYVYNCATDLEPGDLVRIERRQFGSSVQFPDYCHGIVVDEATDHTTSAADCEPLVTLSMLSTAELESELQRRKDIEQASLFGVDIDTYHQLRRHFARSA